MIEHICITTAELVIPIEIQTNKTNAAIETQQLTGEIEIRKCSK